MSRTIQIILFMVLSGFILYAADVKADKTEIGFDEKLGDFIPLDTEFVTSDGDTVSLSTITNKPFILDVVYYNCPGICHPLLSELNWTIDRVQMEPGEDFKVITLSFDPKETPELAAKWKRSYLESMNRKIPYDSWYFLTGSESNIKKITNAVGFNFQEKEGTFLHAGAIIVISPEGKISRYIYGSSFNPFDIKMAIIEAQNEEVRPTSARILQYCFTYDPEGRSYKLNVTRITGAIMMLGFVAFLVILIFKKQKVKQV